MRKRGMRYYHRLFRAYPDLVTTIQFREMLGGIGDTFARKLIHEKKVRSIYIKPYYYISKSSVIEYVLSADYADQKLRVHI